MNRPVFSNTTALSLGLLPDENGKFGDEARARFEELIDEANGYIVAIIERLMKIEGQRDEIQAVREEMRVSEELLNLAGLIPEIIEGDMTWVAAILRAESRRSIRTGAEVREQMRLQREAEKAAAEQAERAAIQSMPTFGMF